MPSISFTKGPHPYPTNVGAAPVLQRGDTFLVIGGLNNSVGTSNLDTVYEFNTVVEDWTLMPQKMNQGKHAVSAMLVGPEDFPKCS